MGDADRRFRLVDVLAARPLRAHGVDLEVGLVDGDVDLRRFRQHGDGGGGGVDAPLRFRVGHALHPVHAALELQPREDAGALHLGDHLLEAAGRALARRHHGDAPAVRLGVAGVHAEQVAGEERRLVSPRAGADLQDGAPGIGGVLGQQGEADAPLQHV